MFKKCSSLLVVVLISFTLISSLPTYAGEATPKTGGDNFPSKPINIIVAYAAGGGSDMIARLISSFLGAELNVPITIENVLGSDTLLGGKRIADSIPDGYTLGVGGDGCTVVAPLVHNKKENIGFGQESYQMIVQIGSWPHILSVKYDAPWANFNEFVEFAKANPGEVTYATAGGSYPINLQIMNKTLGLEITDVPFNGTGETMMAVSGGHVNAVAAGETTVRPLYEDHLIRPIAIMSDRKIQNWPDVPTFKELGLDMRFDQLRQVYAPVGIPEDRLKILESALLKVLTNQDFLKAAATIGEVIAPLGTNDAQIRYNQQYETMRSVVDSLSD
jgi:tripartite-type tricarboxylate transporter receptor subunit TctC